jgi:LPS-assembly lipoprotein
MKRFGISLAAIALLGGCGLKPLYSGGGSGAVAATLGQIEVAPIQGKAGWLVANALRDRLGAVPASGSPRYRLQITLDDQITGLAIRRDDSVARERRSLRARYQLVELGQGGVVLDATAGSDVGIDVVGSDYATIAAESTALERLAETIADQMLTRIATSVGRTPPTP